MKMMRKILLYLFAIIFLFLTTFFLYSFARQTVRKLASPIPTVPTISVESLPTKIPAHEFQFGGKTYQFHFHKILTNESLTLIPNFENVSFSAQIVKQNNCTFGINGGFYKKEGGPLGLFQIGTNKLGIQIQSSTFNGFLSSSPALSISSTPIYPTATSSDFILQTGPLIFLSNTVQPNFIEEDFARRHLIAKATGGNYYLFSIFEKNNVLLGPRLKDLKDIFLTPEFMNISNFELVLNLDGGSASAYYDKNLQIEEFKPIGSFLCGKEN
jgi:hypothetical protein